MLYHQYCWLDHLVTVKYAVFLIWAFPCPGGSKLSTALKNDLSVPKNLPSKLGRMLRSYPRAQEDNVKIALKRTLLRFSAPNFATVVVTWSYPSLRATLASAFGLLFTALFQLFLGRSTIATTDTTPPAPGGPFGSPGVVRRCVSHRLGVVVCF